MVFRSSLLPVLTGILVWNELLLASLVNAKVACSTTEECEQILGHGSKCLIVAGDDGSSSQFCSNPFYEGGCLARFLPNWHKIRVCGSDDPPEASISGACRSAPIPAYQEIRIGAMNWESAFFGAWIMQIVLSEILEVPTSLETGVAGLSTDFYDPYSSLDYGVGYDWEGLKVGNQVGDCRTFQASNRENPESYQSCLHVLPEAWSGSLTAPRALPEPIMETLALGAVAVTTSFVPKFTVERDPSLANYLGLRGQANRAKVAQAFKRPTTWAQYCNEVSPDQCATPDGVALRAPMDEGEENSMFVQDLYIGHFRATEDNDCIANPTNCTGHFVDHPCGWTSYFQQQAYHLDIPMRSSTEELSEGYTYSQQIQIWAAANATKSDVMMAWWNPEALYQDYIGTDAEFIRVMYPPPTQTCEENRINVAKRCGNNFEERVGSPEGACDSLSETLQKVMGLGLREAMEDASFPEELRSPAYSALSNYQMSELQLGDIFENWKEVGIDRWGYDPREATCRWVVDNIDTVKKIIPETYPRVLEEYFVRDSGMAQAALSIACLATFAVFGSCCLLYKNRHTQTVHNLQIEFMCLVLLGLLLAGGGPLFLSVDATPLFCSAAVWVANLGHIFKITPFVLRADGINRLLNAGKPLQRVKITRKRFFAWAFVGLICVVSFNIVRSVIDPPRPRIDYSLTSDTNVFDETTVREVTTCASKSNWWTIAINSAFAVLLLYPFVLTCMSSRAKEDINNAKSLAFPTGIQLIGALSRVGLILLESSVDKRNDVATDSLILSLEVIMVLGVFVLPKLLEKSETQESSEPLPDLFLRTTIGFFDVVGFTAWSSTRSPVQVFNFLETVFGAFDEIAEKHNILKIETVGDCYVAATGIPFDRADHAIAMARFAMDCRNCMNRLTRELEVKFGPDTCDLSIRIGMHSGPVTGGFLRGKSTRFQLFGDTVNVASRMESTGEKGKIQISAETAKLMMECGKGKWLQKREDRVEVKGKGTMESYWLDWSTSKAVERPMSTVSDVQSISQDLRDVPDESKFTNRKERLIEWNVQVLEKLAKKVVARRMAAEGGLTNVLVSSMASRREDAVDKLSKTSTSSIAYDDHTMPCKEVKESISLLDFDRRAAMRQQDEEAVRLRPETLDQLKYFVTTVSSMYKDNPFHNFEHASHVVMSMLKMLGRIVNSTDNGKVETSKSKSASMLHENTYGIASDPLAHFACIFSALIHDIDHPGVPNSQFIKENVYLASMYEYRSVAEQNSFDLAWNLFMEESFDDLRIAICGTTSELTRFRGLVINSVMATDLADQELKEIRNRRWDTVFGDTENVLSGAAPNTDNLKNLKATIVIEHLIQASDVCHTMQHWNIYREWNEKLFMEMYDAYSVGRANLNPAKFWFKGEIDFFDFYIIPLAKKLSRCGVFGVSSDENLNYALENRRQWVEHGEQVVASLLQKGESRSRP